MKKSTPAAAVILAAISISIITLTSPGLYTQPRLERLVIATTTSTVDTGLLDYLKPHFDKKFNADMTWLYLGTGQAIAVAARGDADILLVHDREREETFVKSGNGTHRVTVMYNDFVIVGPEGDPAGIRGLTDASEAFKKIAEAGEDGRALFISRGDRSGTHALEIKIWSKAEVAPQGRRWYIEAGQGMSPTIRISGEKQAYTISDRGTWIKLKTEMSDRLNLQILVEKDNALINPYGLVLLNPQKYSGINSELAERFFLFIVSDEGQRLIEEFKVGGEPVFAPIFGRAESIGLPSEREEVQYWAQRLKESGMKPPSWILAATGSQASTSVDDKARLE